MKKRTAIILLSVMLAILVGAGALAVYSVYAGKADTPVKTKTVDKDGVRTFADWTETEIWTKVPAMIAEGTKIGEEGEYGGGTYVIDVQGTTLEDYHAYQETLKNAGFTKYVDNGETGMDEAIYTATYTKDKLVVTVTQVMATDKTYIYADEDQPLSEHLFYDDKYVVDNKAGAKTTIHMMELYYYGNSFVIQLKNGHFIVNDGGMGADSFYLIDYLESLAPEGEKPIIEAWIISHGHGDHMGAIQQMVQEPEKFQGRFYVEGVYYNEPSQKIFTMYDANSLATSSFVKGFALFAETTSGGHPEVYRPQAGQRYYFNDVVIDIPYAQELLIIENYRQNINESSTWSKYYIDEQEFLLCGDADEGAIEAVMEIYDSEYFEVDIFAVFHHGINVWDKFTDFCKFDTVLFTSPRMGSIWDDKTTFGRYNENQHLISVAKEAMHYGDGTKVLTFPYSVGTAETLPLCDWRYHNGKCIRELHGAEK